jgi:hypothetical protein
MKLRYWLLFGSVAVGAGVALLRRHLRRMPRLSPDEETNLEPGTSPSDSSEPAFERVGEQSPSAAVSASITEQSSAAGKLCGKDDHPVRGAASSETPLSALEVVTPLNQVSIAAVAGTADGQQTTQAALPGRELSESESPAHQAARSPSAQQKREHIEPGKRGGGRTGPVDRTGKPRESEEKQSHEPKPELICFESAREWVLGVELTGSIDPEGATVFQQGEMLLQDERTEFCWRLSGRTGIIEVRYPKGTTFHIDLGSADPLLFKLSGEDHKHGRRVRTVSSGAYLVVVPEEWTRIDLGGGAVEPVSIAGCKAHFFILDDQRREPIAFNSGIERKFSLDYEDPEFELVGEGKVDDICDDLGALFAGKLPRIHARKQENWLKVKIIIFGLEGPGRNKPRWELRPPERDMEQSPLATIPTVKGGWYFLRFYDWSDNLLESFNFRYLHDLTLVDIEKVSPIPGEGGHKALNIKFEHLPGSFIAAGTSGNELSIEGHETWSTATVPAFPRFDQTHWIFQEASQHKVEFSLLVDRIWWTLSKGIEPGRDELWSDKPFTAHRGDFLPTSDKTLHVWFPKPGWVRDVFLYLGNVPRRRYTLSSASRSISIALRDFADTDLSASSGPLELRLCIMHGGAELECTVVSVVPPAQRTSGTQEPPGPEPIDRTRANCSNCDHAKTRKGIVRTVRCTRHHWSIVFPEDFARLHARDCCSEWIGEYLDENGVWTSATIRR